MLQLREERLSRGWSLTALSGRTGINASVICQIELGHQRIFPGWRRRLSQAFGIPAEELFENIPKPPSPEGSAPAEERGSRSG